MRKKKRLNTIIHTMVICMICVFFCPSAVDASEKQRETVRVGYYPVSDYQEISNDGIYSGFSYDYYIQIQKYTRWNYEFVEGSYADCMKMLMNGEIDVMSGLTASPEREGALIYSEYSNSNSQYKIYAREDDENRFYESYDTFNGSKIGMVTGVRTDGLDQYCKDHDFTVDVVYYNSYEELEKALADGEVDMVCGASLSDHAKTKIVARLKKQPLYYAVTKSKPEIAAQLDDALQKITDNNPEFYTQMSEKYKINGANAAATFTREEDEYIKSGKTIYLIVNNDLAPISWLDKKTGEYRGISIDVAKELEKYSGLNIEPILGDEFDKMTVDNPDIMGDALVLTADDNAWANNMSIMMTNHVIDSTIVMITEIGKSVDLTKEGTVIALPRNFYISYRLKDLTEGKTVKYYDTVTECFDAVNKGKADITFENSLVARYYLSMQKYSNLYIYTESGFSENLSYGVYKDSDTPLLSILDKSLLCIGTTKINEIAIRYAAAEEQFSIEGLYYSNPALMISIILIFCGLIGLILFFRVKAINAQKQGKQEKTLARFMGYVCTANEDVMEVSLTNDTAQSYRLDDSGEVVVKEFPYKYTHGQNDNEQIYPEDFDKLIDCFSEAALDDMIDHVGGGQYFECRAKDEDGEYRWYSYNMQAIPKDKEHPRNFILFKKDIDNVKKEEKESRQILEDALKTAKEASEAKDFFLSRMSHELRTPLNAIGGYATVMDQNIMEDTYDKNKAHSYMESIRRAVKYQLAIIGDLLDIQKIESGKMELDPVEVDFSEYIKNIVSMVIPESKEKGVEFTYERLNRINGMYLLDGVRFEQVLLNLLYNAVKFTPAGGKVNLTAEVIEQGATTDTLQFVISDTGIGMSRDFQQNNLFRKFAQEYKGNTSPYEGCGTGLAISKEIIDLMGGTITCESTQGEGTTFTIILSAKHLNKKRKRKERKKYPVYDLSGIKILLCEDNEMNQDMERRLLEKMKCTVEIAEDGKVGVDMFRESPEGSYDVVLMDIRMPNMDGLEATRKIRGMDRDDAKNVPIIAVSANSFEEDVQKSLDAGMNEHLAKPVDLQIIYEKISQYCKKVV